MTYEYPEIKHAIKISKSQKGIYQPSSFWKQASEDILTNLEEHGLENFRTISLIFSYFAPKYGMPINSFNEPLQQKINELLQTTGNPKQQLAMNEFLSGYSHALSDYRVFAASDKNSHIKPNLSTFSESNYGNPVEQFEFDGKMYSRSALNYLLGLSFLKNHIQHDDEIKTVLEIGGGFGTLGEILHYSEDIKYINVDIPPVSFVSWSYLENIYGKDNIEPYLNEKSTLDIGDLKHCSVFNAWDIEKLEGEIDLFVNFISFQEMEPNIVDNYLSHVKRLSPKYILLRNMREGKQVKTLATGHGVEVPILKDDYMKMISDQYSLLEANVFPYGYKTVDGYHSELLLFRRR